MQSPHIYLGIGLAAMVGCLSGSLAKDGYSLLAPEEMQALKASMNGKVDIPTDVANATDEELWDYVPPATLRRAVFLGPFEAGCPEHGKDVYRAGGSGFYPWKRSADKPWKIQCPVGGESYPSNDFGAYFKGGMKEKLDTTQPYVDDGTGWVNAKGERFFFVGYWVFWQRWYDVLKAIRAFTDAYFATDDETYAHKAAVVFCAMAEQYPKMDYPKQGTQGCGGMILPWCWENQSVVTPMSECYDRLFPYLKKDGDAALQAFIKTKTDLGPRRQIEQRFMQTVAKTNFTTDMYWSNECDHQLALADLALAWDNNDPADGITTKAMIDWLIKNGGDNSLEELILNSTYRDGFPCEGAIGYSAAIAGRQLQIAERLKRCGMDLFKAYPRLKHVAGCWIDMTLEDGHCPSVGDAGSILGSGRQWDAAMFHLAWDNYGDPKFAQALSKIKSMRRTPYAPDRTAEFAAVIQEHGERLNHKTRNLGGMGLAILESGGPLNPRGLALYYGSPAGGHSHHDRLNIEFFDHRQSVLPDFGYPDQWGRKATDFTQNSIGHYSVLVDEKSEQYYMTGDLDFIKGFDGVQIVSARAERCFPGTSLYRRTTALIDISPAAGYVVDIFRVRGGKQHDWCFHLPPVPEWAIEGVTLSEPPAKGTLAGEDIAEGAEMPKDQPRNGFNWMTKIQRAQPAGAFTFLGKANPPYPQLRMTMLPDCAQEIITGDHESPRIKGVVPPTVKFLLARNRGEGELSSAFAAVIEACPKEPAITAISRLETTGGKEPVAMRVQTAGFSDVIVADETGQTPVTVKDTGEFHGRWGLARQDAQGVAKMVLVNGRRLKVGNAVLECTDAWTGKITAVDFKQNTLVVDTALPGGDTLKGEWMIISNDQHSTCYEIAAVEGLSQGQGTRIRLTEISPMVGKGYVDKIEEPARTIHTDTRWRVFGKDYIWSNNFGPVLAGYTLMNEDLSAAFRIEDCKLMPSRTRQWWKPEPAWIKLAGTEPFATAFTDADGDGRTGFWVYDFNVGDSFRITGSAMLQRVGPRTWSLRRSGGDATLALPCPLPLTQVAARGADDQVQMLPCNYDADAKTASFAVPPTLASPVALCLRETQGLDATDRDPPAVKEILVDGKPQPITSLVQLDVSEPPRTIEIRIEDDKNAIDAENAFAQAGAKTVYAGQAGVTLELAKDNPRQAMLRLDPTKIVEFESRPEPTVYSLVVTVDDVALDDRVTCVAFRFTLGPRIADGAAYLSDQEPVKAFAHGGVKRDMNYTGGEIRLGGVPYRKGLTVCPETTNGPVNYGEAIYDLPAGKFKTFRAVIGIDDAAGGGSVIFSVQLQKQGGEWQDAFKSGVLAKGVAPQSVAVSLGDADKIRLYTDASGDIGCDHALFAAARLEP
ncbi:MAG: hypothetical protein A3K19_28965 [Lentisphaerae bacterium RIFOXYB12_FULL_65_16]|nr:MAG: hypothetical protein A3K18_25550 [Lentisphaerae bacterium RIFOXYA12_64_32]OGV88324.1 MAG: hypothetical protein A3K19_28965 [Lentisphaerae bacterium RIFOXYB12_FULL_65_16]